MTSPLGSEAYGSDDEEGARDKKVLLLGGGLAALVLAAGAFFFLGGGESTDEEFVPSARPRPAPSAVEATPAPPQVVPAVSEVSPGRNPFRALVSEPVAEVAAEPAPVTPVSGAPVASGGAAPSGGSPTSPVSPAPVAAPYDLTLVAISQPTDPTEGRSYSFSYGETALDVIPGQRFGTYGELVVLSFIIPEDGSPVTQAVLQVGDATPFTMTVGQTQQVL